MIGNPESATGLRLVGRRTNVPAYSSGDGPIPRVNPKAAQKSDHRIVNPRTEVKSDPRRAAVRRSAAARARRSSGPGSRLGAARGGARGARGRARAARRATPLAPPAAEPELVARALARAAELARPHPGASSTRPASCCTPTSAAPRSRRARRARSRSPRAATAISSSTSRAARAARAAPRSSTSCACSRAPAAALAVNNNAAAVLLVLAGARARAGGDRLARRAGRDRRLVPRARDHGVGGREAGRGRHHQPHAPARLRGRDRPATRRCCSRCTAATSSCGASSPRRAWPSSPRSARARGLPLVEDLGSGTLVDLAPRGLPAEVCAPARLASGADLVCFSGDKLLGGPQAGIVLARDAELADRLRRDPLARALRLDKLSLAALDWTLACLLDGRAERELPGAAQLLARARRAAAARRRARRAALRERGVPGQGARRARTAATRAAARCPSTSSRAGWCASRRDLGAAAARGAAARGSPAGARARARRAPAARRAHAARRRRGRARRAPCSRRCVDAHGPFPYASRTETHAELERSRPESLVPADPRDVGSPRLLADLRAPRSP